jgi:aspartyl-tRNA(Asn)/glutamyl-tRNA(Gln) amidotransferase subunit A
MKDILKMDIMTLHKHIANKEISCMEITAAYLQNIEKKDEKIKAYITVTKEEAEKRAKSLDERLSLNSNIPLLYGIPGALKDNICTKGILTTCASKMLYDFIAPYDATVYEKLNDNGMTLLGKLNMDEFAMGSTTTTSYFHKTYNPYDLSKSCGGSSGGSAAAVASEQTLFALGSDTGGSIRQPASFCNVVGMKPTYGTVSRYGLIAFASSLDQIGPMTRTVYDNALVLDAISGYDKKDSTSVMKPSGSYTDDIGKDIKNMKMGVIRQFAAKKIDSQVVNTVNEAINWYEKQGVEIVELDMPSLDWAIYAYYIISSAEASSNLARFDGIRYGYRPDEFEDIDRLYEYSRSNGFDTEVKRRIMLGTFVLSQGYFDQYYNKAQKVRRLVETEFDRAFKECDFILAPVAASTAYDIKDAKKDAVAMYMEDIFTVPVNIAKLPAIALPGAMSEENLPIGIQLIGPKLSEKTLYRAGYAYEKRNSEVSHV